MKLLHVDNPFENDPEVSQAEKDAFLSLKNDAEVYPVIASLGLTKAEVRIGLATLIEYQDDVHICAQCPGLDNCPKARRGYCMSLSRERGNLHQNFYPCKLQRAYEEGQALYSRRDFPEEWLGKGLRNIEHSASTRNPLLKEMVTILKRNSGRWLYVLGDSKSGKSFVLACFANEVARLENGVAFLNTKAVFDELKEQSLKAPGKFARNMNLLCCCPLVVFDGFGSEFKSRYVFETLLRPIIKARAEQGLLTAFSSRYPLEKAIAFYRKKVDDEEVDALLEIMQKKTKKEFDITGIPLYS